MKKLGGRWMWILAAALLLAAPWWTLARPQLPDRGHLIDEARSLARAQDVRLKVIPLPEPLLKAGGNDDAHRALLEEELIEAQFMVDDNERLPMLVSRVVVNTDPDHPEMLAFYHILAVHQRVLVDRLGTRLFVPTASISNVQLATKQNAARKLEQLMRQNLRALSDTVSQATKAEELSVNENE